MKYIEWVNQGLRLNPLHHRRCQRYHVVYIAYNCFTASTLSCTDLVITRGYENKIRPVAIRSLNRCESIERFNATTEITDHSTAVSLLDVSLHLPKSTITQPLWVYWTFQYHYRNQRQLCIVLKKLTRPTNKHREPTLPTNISPVVISLKFI